MKKRTEQEIQYDSIYPEAPPNLVELQKNEDNEARKFYKSLPPDKREKVKQVGIDSIAHSIERLKFEIHHKNRDLESQKAMLKKFKKEIAI